MQKSKTSHCVFQKMESLRFTGRDTYCVNIATVDINRLVSATCYVDMLDMCKTLVISHIFLHGS